MQKEKRGSVIFFIRQNMEYIFVNYRNYFLISMTAVILITLAGCDWSAKWDLRRAEKVLNEAAALNADTGGDPKAKRAYFKAQAALEEGMYYARRRDVNLARDKAQEAKDWAEEAVMWAQWYIDDIEREKEALGTYKE